MTDLTPLTPLGRTAPHKTTAGPLHISEQTDVALASLSIARGAARPSPFGLDLPNVGKCVAGEGKGAFWIGHNTWMVEAAGKAETNFAAALARAVPDCAVTDQTDGYAWIDVTGSDADLNRLFAKLVNIDPKALVTGTAVRTGLDHMTVFVVRRSAEQVSFLGLRSYAGSLWHAIETAACRLDA